MRTIWAGLTVLALTLGCAGPNIRYDYDSRANYSTFHTYDWYAPSKAAMARAGGVQNPIMDTRVRRAVEAELASRKFQRETDKDPDFLVTYYPVYMHRRGGGARLGVGFGFGFFRSVGVGVSAPVGERRPTGAIGSIVLEVQDFKTHQLLWSATAENVLDDTDTPEGSDEDVAKAVRKMLDRFPPAPPKS
jgi:hypothetical protein